MFGEYIAFLAWCGVPRNIFILIQGPKFVSDEEIERIKAKIEEDNRAIAMGNYFFTDLKGNEAKVEYTFGYKLVEGQLKIDLHHSSFPYNP